VRLVLLGDPVAHSRSPAIQQAALAAAGIEGSYEARRVDTIGVYRACAELRSGFLRGANVTMPHKRVAAAAADRLTAIAGRCGAVNTLVGEAGEVVGDNTDAGGLLLARDRAGIAPGLPVEPAPEGLSRDVGGEALVPGDEVGVDAGLHGPLAEKTGAEGVDRGDLRRVEVEDRPLGAPLRDGVISGGGLLLERLPQPRLHLASRLFGEGHGRDRADRNAVGHDVPDDPADQRRRLPGAGRGLDEEGGGGLPLGPLADGLVGERHRIAFMAASGFAGPDRSPSHFAS